MVNALDKNGFWEQATSIKPTYLDSVRKCLIMVPHPDDESLACAGLISMLLAKGIKVELILTTDGSRSHPNSKKFPPEKLAELRVEELKIAMHLLGLKKENLRCYHAQDANMPSKGMKGFDVLVDRLTADLVSIAPDLILVPYELDPHCDHRATHQLLISSLEMAHIARPKIWEYPIWLYEYALVSDIPKLKLGELLSLDIKDYAEVKAACIYAHKSQTTPLVDDDPHGFILLPEVIANFMQGHEYFMERQKINPTSTLQSTYFEDMYRNNFDPWDFEKSVYEFEKYQHTIAAIPDGDYRRVLEIGCSIGVLTEMIAKRYEHVLAMDISQIALKTARERLQRLSNVDFLLGGIPQDFPKGNFDLIVMSEVGYYLAMPDLLNARKMILAALEKSGVLILVHWIHFVTDYPLTGDQVHECFHQSGLLHITEKRTADYRLDVYKKQ